MHEHYGMFCVSPVIYTNSLRQWLSLFSLPLFFTILFLTFHHVNTCISSSFIFKDSILCFWGRYHILFDEHLGPCLIFYEHECPTICLLATCAKVSLEENIELLCRTTTWPGYFPAALLVICITMLWAVYKSSPLSHYLINGWYQIFDLSVWWVWSNILLLFFYSPT